MINEHKKGVKAMKYTTKAKNPVAKAHQTIGTGSGVHKDKKRSEKSVRGHKHKEKDISGMLEGIAGAVAGGIAGGVLTKSPGGAMAGAELGDKAQQLFSRNPDVENEDSNPEYDDEAGMADNNLETLKRAVQGLDDLIDSNDNLPEWCQEKIAVAKSMLVAVWDYMKSEEDRGASVTEVDDEEGDEEEWYDKDGRPDPNGAYDAAGHYYLERDVNESLRTENPCWKGYKPVGTKKKGGRTVPNCVPKEGVEEGKQCPQCGSTTCTCPPGKCKCKPVKGWLTKNVEEDWQKVNKQDKTDGMSSKAVKAYRRENPGSKLKTAVTTKPSKLKAGSKDANRRKSFCARMGGVKGPMKDEKGRPTAKAKALSRWNCESVDPTPSNDWYMLKLQTLLESNVKKDKKK